MSSMVEPELRLLEVDSESSFRDALELRKPMLGISPKTLDAVDVAAASAKLVSTMMDTEMLLIPKIHQPIVAAPAVGVDGTFDVCVSTDDPLKRMRGGIRNNLGVYLPVALVQAEYDRLVPCSASSFSLHPAWPEVALVRFDLPSEWRGFLRVLIDSSSNQ